MKRFSPSRIRAFTLVELLVVIAIIMLLIAILLPLLWKFQRRAAVLVCPIVYAAPDGSVRLTNPRGSFDIELAPYGTVCWNTAIQYPSWSPDGTRIAFTIHEDKKGQPLRHYIGICNPATGKVTRLDSVTGPPESFQGFLPGWADHDQLIELTRGKVHLRDADSGQVTGTIHVPWQDTYVSLSRLPLCADGHYVTWLGGADGQRIVILRKDFTVRKTIWVERASPSYAHPAPRCDPFGEYVAWTTRDPAAGGMRVAMKPIKAPSYAPPDILGRQFRNASFCDWTEDGRLLVVADGSLAIIDRLDTLIQTIPNSYMSYHEGAAAWRKYGHQ